MSMVPYLPLPCELTEGFWLLRLLLLYLLLLSWAAYHRTYPQGWAKTPLLKIPRSWRLKPRTPEACEACQKRLTIQLFRPWTDVVPYRETKSPCGRRKILNTAGHACPNPACAYFAVTDETLHAVVGNGKRGKCKDIQYWQCQACQKKFTSRLHTPLYQLKTDPEKVILVLRLLANGCDLSVLVRCTPHAEATVTRWLEKMGAHSQRLQGRMFQQLVFPLLQLDELYARVRREGVKWLWVALDPVTKVIPTLSLGPRTTEAAMQFVHHLAEVLVPGCVPAFTTDGLRAYFYALTAHFGQWTQAPGQRKAHWQVSPDLLHGQLVKRKGQAQFAVMRMAWGPRAALAAVLKAQGFKTLIQTAFVERVNLTIRRGIAPLMRKTWAYAQTTAHLHLHLEWWRADYHFVRPHESLGQKILGLGRQRLRSPGMAAGLTGRLWTVGELLRLPLWPALT
jgi:IS1 family transposase/transposase-like protein